ncbi:MAG: hypothetical protein IJG13_12225 [Kiritimatiellae bacterium]|nr:hypothetical protein [Kiritimatiellia bacterium]MBQ6327771.1 hypothetical protein [Kiritimatiellia bacterium]
MSRGVIVAALAALVSLAAPAAEELEEASDGGGGYIGAAAAMTLPQGGSSMRRLGGGALRAGWYLGEFWALEGEAAWLENSAGLGVDALWHLQGWSLYGDLFGYSRFDPFLTAGARGWIGGSAGQVGPSAGIGTFWHLTDEWSLRFDAAATLGLDTETEVVYSLSVGVQRSF